MEITFENYNRTETLTNFPVLVVFSNNMAESEFDYSAFVSTNGADLRFADVTSGSKLNFEIEKWNTAGVSFVWVQVPALSSNAGIVATWGDSSDAALPEYATNGAAWSANYEAVWHMGQIGCRDSAQGIMLNGTGATTVNAILGSGQSFSGVSDLTSAQNFSLGSATFSCWFKASSTSDGFLINKNEGPYTVAGWGVKVQSGNLLIYDDLSNTDQQYYATPVSIGSWYFCAISMSWNGTNWTEKMCLNGSLVGSNVTTGSSLGTSRPIYVGHRGGGGNAFSGIIDEVRISGVARSTNWVWACYMNVVSNGAFNSYHTVELLPKATILMVQ